MTTPENTSTTAAAQDETAEQPKYLRRIRSFVLREGRLTKGQQRSLELFWPTMGLEHQPQPYDFEQVFGRKADLVLEIGFGMGKSFVEMAKASPELDFIGIEVHKPGVGACLGEAETEGVKNIRLFEHDAVEILNDSIADNSLTTIQLFFPDPWHKTRHHKRRIVQPDFVQVLRRKLKIGGVFHMATDWENYAEHMLEVMTAAEGYQNLASDNLYVPRPDNRPLTKFENRGVKLGHGVWDLMFKKTN